MPEAENPASLYTRICEEIAYRDYAEIPFSLSQKELHRAANSFLAFLMLPQEQKEAFHFMVDPENRGTKVGYSWKNKGKGDGDDKEYFHYNEYAEREFAPLLASPDSLVASFFKAARAVYAAAKQTFSTVIRACEMAFPAVYEEFFPPHTLPNFYLRFLKYDIAGAGNFLARAHYDRGACTLALAESAPGLRIGRNPETLREVEHKDHFALFMPALTFSKTTSSLFHPTWHDVVQKSNDTFSESVARWAIVFFADQINVRSVSSTEVYTPQY